VTPSVTTPSGDTNLSDATVSKQTRNNVVQLENAEALKVS